jgi:hypothetical protein
MSISLQTAMGERDILEILEEVIRTTDGILSVADAAASTGVGLQQAREALVRLMELYPAVVGIDEHGSTILTFTLPLRRRRPMLLGERLRTSVAAALRHCKHYARVATVITVVAYVGWIDYSFRLIVGCTVIAITSAVASTEEKKGIRGAVVSMRKIIRKISRDYFQQLSTLLTPGKAHLRYESESQAYLPPRKPWLHAVADFVAGEERVEDKADLSRQLASYLRTVSPLLTSSDIVFLTGCSFSEADELLAYYAVQFGAELQIDAEGVMIADFCAFVQDSMASVETSVHFWWQQTDLPFRSTGNHPLQNYAIIFTFLIAIVWSYLVSSGPSDLFDSSGTGAWGFVLEQLPGYISALLLAIAVFRVPSHFRLEHLRLRRLFLKNVLRSLFESDRESLEVAVVTANQDSSVNLGIGSREASDLLALACRWWDGRIELLPSGATSIRFDRIERERLSLARARHNADLPT